MTLAYDTLPGGSRLSFGGDEFLFVELSEAMDLATSLHVQSLAVALREMSISGIVDIVPAHVSYLVRVHPEVLDPRDLVPVLRDLHRRLEARDAGAVIPTRILRIPTLYDDPWGREVAARFRDRHPSPEETDVEFVARVNGYASTRELIDAHAAHPFIVTFNNFVPGNAEFVQLVPREMQIQAPKYLRPRTDTPDRALGHGGNQGNIYPARSPGGFQLLGRSALPVLDFSMRTPGFADGPVLLPSPTLIKFESVDLSGYEEVRAGLAAGTFAPAQADIEFDIAAFERAPLDYATALTRELP